MPIMVVTFPDVEGVSRKVRDEFVLSLLGHRVFKKNLANAKAKNGIRAALAKADGNAMKLAETDHACLRVAAETPEYEVWEVGPDGNPRLKGYEDGYQLAAVGVDAFIPVIEAIMNAVEETADAPKAEAKPAEAPLKAVP